MKNKIMSTSEVFYKNGKGEAFVGTLSLYSGDSGYLINLSKISDFISVVIKNALINDYKKVVDYIIFEQKNNLADIEEFNKFLEYIGEDILDNINFPVIKMPGEEDSGKRVRELEYDDSPAFKAIIS